MLFTHGDTVVADVSLKRAKEMYVKAHLGLQLKLRMSQTKPKLK